MATILAPIAVMTALAMGVTIEVGWVQLRDRAVTRGWLRAGAAAIALVPGLAVAAQLLGLSTQALVIGEWLPALAMWVVTAAARRRFPRGVRSADPKAPVFVRVEAAWQALELGDLDGAARALDEARSVAEPDSVAYVDLCKRLVEEERRRRGGELLSSESTRDAITLEFTRLLSRRARPSPPLTLAIIVIGAAMAVGVPLALSRFANLAP